MNLVPADARRLRVMHKAARNGDMAADRRMVVWSLNPAQAGLALACAVAK
jgi:hypothetical protein